MLSPFINLKEMTKKKTSLLFHSDLNSILSGYASLHMINMCYNSCCIVRLVHKINQNNKNEEKTVDFCIHTDYSTDESKN